MEDTNQHPPTRDTNGAGDGPADENSGQSGSQHPAHTHQGWVPTAPGQTVPQDTGQWTPPPPADWAPRGPNQWAAPQQGSDWGPDDPYRGSGGWNPTPPPPPAWGPGQPGQPGQPGHPGQPQYPGGGGGWPGGGGPGGPPSQPGGWATPWSPEYRPPRPPRTLPSTVIALLLVAAILVGLGIGHGVWKNSVNPSGNASGPAINPFGGNSGGSGAPQDTSSIVARVSPALVDINTSLSYQHGQAAGTGIVLSPDGVVLTNNHVISGATSISVTDIGNGKTYPADVLGYDRTHDVAVIKLRNASGLQTAVIGNSDRVSVGDGIVGIGNAGGVGGTPSSAPGQVTALNQSITANDDSNGTTEQLTGLIQTNANIQPGDSGGALANSKGQVIGIDTAASAGFSFQTQGNQGFAIPINQAQTIATQIRNSQPGATVHIGSTAFLGVLVDTTASASGATLSGVVSGGPASQAGLQSGDTIVTLAGKPVDNPNTLTALIGQYHPGDRVAVGWVDPSGQSHQASVQLGTGPAA
ncbi:MAG TPA: trypsin-like peptidase domain-containing protein [Acidimicrobiales bacterium]|nr:trypsin-like peptidase domain-containing protein [Acidimicrobiales bacterium]